jgi:hypothetical protein
MKMKSILNMNIKRIFSTAIFSSLVSGLISCSLSGLIFCSILIPIPSSAANYDHLFNDDGTTKPECAALFLAQLQGGGTIGGSQTAGGMDAVMDYFIMGVYLNAILIERSGAKGVEAAILARAHQELPGRKAMEMTLDLDDVIAKQKPSKKTKIVYRGQGANVPKPQNGEMYEVGEILKFPQFLSTSPSLALANFYVKGILLHIEVPIGVRALNVQQFMGTPSEQYELLFARDSSVV